MNRLLILPVLLLTLLAGTPAFSADYKKGLTAALSGDYATALREWEPLAKQGCAEASQTGREKVVRYTRMLPIQRSF